ncbi:MAG TPA: hypothetical protein DEQ48_03560 [Helicobacter sp.]|nr:hypothetical protein [Helicobacter sp.]
MKTYTHKIKGGEYFIITLAIYKTNNADTLAIVYKNTQDEVFIRDYKDFKTKFKILKHNLS